MSTSALSPLAVPRRVVFAGDWHMNTSWAVAAVEEAKELGGDVIVHLGDFGYSFRQSFLAGLSKALDEAALSLLFVDGNHEQHRWLARQPIGAEGLRPLGERIFHLPRGFRWTWDEVRFLALGGAHSVDGQWRRASGDLWFPEERLTDADVATAVAGGPADVLVSHDCPAGVDIPDLPSDMFPPLEIARAEEHRQVLRGVVDQAKPRMIWHGHYHIPYLAQPDFGWGPVTVHGLDMDATSMRTNLHAIDLADIKEQVDTAAAVYGENK